jgi:putative AlgH/UPF0301 family transcriptional regulator
MTGSPAPSSSADWRDGHLRLESIRVSSSAAFGAPCRRRGKARRFVARSRPLDAHAVCTTGPPAARSATDRRAFCVERHKLVSHDAISTAPFSSPHRDLRAAPRQGTAAWQRAISAGCAPSENAHPRWQKGWTIVVMKLKLQPSLWIAAVLSASLNAPAQSMRVKDLALGKLLVAPRNAPDPRFAGTVILLVQYDRQSAVGLMVNRRTETPISRALQEWKLAKQKSDPVYSGGPMEVNGVLALLRLATKPGDAAHVVGDVYVASSRSLVKKALTAGTGPGAFRIYLGYCGWGPGQLENEVELGVWYIFSGNAGLVFDSDPASLWSRLIVRTEQRIVRDLAPNRGPCYFAIGE